jgi:hypothetical protein
MPVITRITIPAKEDEKVTYADLKKAPPGS